MNRPRAPGSVASFAVTIVASPIRSCGSVPDVSIVVILRIVVLVLLGRDR